MDSFQEAHEKARKQKDSKRAWNQKSHDYFNNAQDRINSKTIDGDIERLKAYPKYWKILETLKKHVAKAVKNVLNYEKVIDKYEEAWTKGLTGLRRQEVKLKEQGDIRLSDLIIADLIIKVEGETIYLVPSENIKVNEDGKCLLTLDELKLMEGKSEDEIKWIIGVKERFLGSKYVKRKEN